MGQDQSMRSAVADAAVVERLPLQQGAVGGHHAGSFAPGWIAILVVITLAELVFAMETALVFAALPRAMAEYRGNPAVGWLTTAYFLVGAASVAICSVLGDKFGRKRVLMLVFVSATIGSIVSAIHTDLFWIVTGRAIQGLAGAVMPLCYGLVKENLPSHRVSFGIGLVTGASVFGAAIAFIVGGLIVDQGHWQDIFKLSAGLSLFAIAGCGLVLPRSPRRGVGKIDLLGGILFVPGILALSYAVLNARVDTSMAPVLIPAGLAILVLWIVHEARHPNPLIDVKLFRSREIALANFAVAFTVMGAYYTMQLFPLLMQQPPATGIGFGKTATETGFYQLPGVVLSVAASIFAGAMMGRLGSRTILIVGATIGISAWTCVMFSTDIWLTTFAMLSSSAGAVLIGTGAVSIIVAAAPIERTAEAAGVNGVVSALARSIGGIVVSGLLATGSVTLAGNVYPSPASYRLTIIYIIATAVIVLICGLALRKGGAISPGDRAQLAR